MKILQRCLLPSQRCYKYLETNFLFHNRSGFCVRKVYSSSFRNKHLYSIYFHRQWGKKGEMSDEYIFYNLLPLVILSFFLNKKDAYLEGDEGKNSSISNKEPIILEEFGNSRRNVELGNLKNVGLNEILSNKGDPSPADKKISILPAPSEEKTNKDSKKSLPPIPFEYPKEKSIQLKVAIEDSRKIIHRKMSETGAPGMLVAVSIDGKNVWQAGFGYADVENYVQCTPYTVMRIASISKSLTMTAVARLQEEGKLDIDLPIHNYVSDFPTKKFNGQEVTITTRQLLNHTSGIRHYKLKDEKCKNDKNLKSKTKLKGTKFLDQSNPSENLNEKKKHLLDLLAERMFQEPEKEDDSEFNLHEYQIKEEFKTTSDALKLFENDELHFKPGDRYLYSTHAWTLVAAVIEGASGKKFIPLMNKLFHDLDLNHTCADRNEPIIYKRASYYIRDKNGRLKNAPYVNNSYKWAGGGFISTVADLNQFGNAMLYSYQCGDGSDEQQCRGFLKSSTVKQMWTRSLNSKCDWDQDGSYGLGWGLVEGDSKSIPFCHKKRFYASHTGGAVGASSVLLILPRETNNSEIEISSSEDADGNELPKGVIVSMITNMQSVGLNAIALEIAKSFEKVNNNQNIVGQISDRPDSKVFSLNSA